MRPIAATRNAPDGALSHPKVVRYGILTTTRDQLPLDGPDIILIQFGLVVSGPLHRPLKVGLMRLGNEMGGVNARWVVAKVRYGHAVGYLPEGYDV